MALKGWNPESQIGAEQLAAMPKLHAFALETLRLHPPARPSRLRLSAPTELGGWLLDAGTLVQPEPFVAHLRADVYAEPRRFDPERYLQAESAPLPLGFAGAVQGGRGAELATSVAKATFVQMRRMFDLRLDQETLLVPKGYPLFSISESCKALCEAKMYYELKRENRKLKF